MAITNTLLSKREMELEATNSLKVKEAINNSNVGDTDSKVREEAEVPSLRETSRAGAEVRRQEVLLLQS